MICDKEARFPLIVFKCKKFCVTNMYTPYAFCMISPFSARATRSFCVVAFGTAPFRLAATSTAPKGRFICWILCQYSAYMRLCRSLFSDIAILHLRLMRDQRYIRSRNSAPTFLTFENLNIRALCLACHCESDVGRNRDARKWTARDKMSTSFQSRECNDSQIP